MHLFEKSYIYVHISMYQNCSLFGINSHENSNRMLDLNKRPLSLSLCVKQTTNAAGGVGEEIRAGAGHSRSEPKQSTENKVKFYFYYQCNNNNTASDFKWRKSRRRTDKNNGKDWKYVRKEAEHWGILISFLKRLSGGYFTTLIKFNEIYMAIRRTKCAKRAAGSIEVKSPTFFIIKFV